MNPELKALNKEEKEPLDKNDAMEIMEKLKLSSEETTKLLLCLRNKWGTKLVPKEVDPM